VRPADLLRRRKPAPSPSLPPHRPDYHAVNHDGRTDPSPAQLDALTAVDRETADLDRLAALVDQGMPHAHACRTVWGG